MTRKAVIELVTRRLKYTDSKNQFSLPYVQGALDIVWQQLCVDIYNKKIQDLHYYTKKFTPVALVEDSDEMYYSELPSELIRLPRIGDGVISINQVNSRSADFKPLSEYDFRLMTSQEVYRIGGDIYFYVTYDKVFFGDSITTEIATEGVDMNLVIPLSRYDFDEEIPLPSGQSRVFTQMALEYLAGTPMVNTENKNSM